jgi:DNA-directed RNA polymerase subunit H (RpoH/RPB5)
MLVARGDDLASFPEDVDDEDELNELRTTNKKYETDKTVVFFALTKELMTSKDKKSVMAHIKNAPEFIETHGAHTFILVFGDIPASPVLQMLADRDREFQTLGASMQYFTLSELQYNPANHVLVPKHEKMSVADTKQIMQDYQIRTKSQLPVISKVDIMARWLGLKHGDVVRITRTNENSGIYFYYRCCV